MVDRDREAFRSNRCCSDAARPVSQQVVILVLASRIEALRGLLLLLDARFRVIIHLDAKTDASGLALPAHASLTDVRFEVYWAGFSMFLAIREMIDTAYRVAPGFRRAVMLSGESLPLCPSDALEAVLLDERREHIDLYEIPNDPGLRGLTMAEVQRQANGNIMAWRFQNASYLDDALVSPRSHHEVMQKYGVSGHTADYLRGNAMKIADGILARLPPRPALYDRFYYGASWWALTRAAIDLVIDEMHAQAHVEYFRFLQAPDEHCIQTLLGNKQRALSSLGRQVVGTPVFVDHGDPQRGSFGRDALTAEKFRQAAGTGHLFARKFDPELTPDIAIAIVEGRYFSDIVGA